MKLVLIGHAMVVHRLVEAAGAPRGWGFDTRVVVAARPLGGVTRSRSRSSNVDKWANRPARRHRQDRQAVRPLRRLRMAVGAAP